MTDMPATIRFYRDRLPHWEVYRGRYFVTLRLAGSIPKAGVERIKRYGEQLLNLPEDSATIIRIRRKIFLEMEHWLDNAKSVEYLNHPAAATVIKDAITFREQVGDWTIFSYVIMPNHIHLFFRLGNDGKGCDRELNLKRVMNSFKRWTATKIKQQLELEGCFWQREWFDHWSRSNFEDQKITRYIINNPVKAGLVQQPEDWPYYNDK